ncbi:MAG: flavin reductase family protein [Flavobacteriales bacterium]|nr:flavin reductase family protein [Flavobacteriales bacterium]
MLRINPTELPTPKVHGYLLGAIGPRPICFASTVDAEGRPNLSPFSFFNVFSADPPLCIFSPARRGTNNTTKDTYHNVKATKEVVINVVTYAMVEQMSLASTEYPPEVNEFEKAGFTMLKSELVKPFRVAESPVQLECTVDQVIETGDRPGAGNLVICRVVLMHVKEAVLDTNGRIDQQRIDLVARMGGNWYCRAHGDALFEVEKPIGRMGIGVDGLPQAIRESRYLTGNDLGRLGNTEVLPDETSVNEYKLTELSELFITHQDDAAALEKALHLRAHELLEAKRVDEAWRTLLAFNEH